MSWQDDSVVLENAWSKTLPILKKIFETDNYKNVVEILSLYTNVELYCSQPPNGITSVHQKRVGCRGGYFYLRLQDFFTSFCESVREKCAKLKNEDLLRLHNTEWKKYASKSPILDYAFGYINKHYIARENAHAEEDPTKKGKQLYNISGLAVITWKETFFDNYDGKIDKAVNELINRERRGETIDSSFISDVVKCYSILGTNVDDINNSMCVYKDNFEKSFLEETERFYVEESTEFLERGDVMEYAKKVEIRFQEEKTRVNDYLDSSTESLLEKTLQSSLVKKYLNVFYAEFKKLLMSDKIDDIKCLYSLLFKHVEDLSEFTDIFHEHVYDEGMASIQKCAEFVSKNPKIYTDSITMVYKKYLNLIAIAFSEHKNFKIAFEKSIKQIVNRNFLTMEPNTARKSSELVTKYCDQLLRNVNLNQKEELEQGLNDISIIFLFIEDKDVFHEYYMKLLAKRLVNKTSNDEELESNMILKIKESTDTVYVAKFERMLQDMKLSTDINQQFSQEYRKQLDVDLEVMVLQFGAWPFETSPRHNLPIELEKCVGQFTQFYTAKHSGKKLIWMYNLSKGEIFTNNYKSRYSIQASTMQISILMLFNSSASWTLGQIQGQTGIAFDVILQIIQILLKARLLTCKNAKMLTQDSKIYLNKSYNNKKHRVNINVPLKAEIQKEQVAFDKNIDEGRKFIVQAVIVRIMKSKKTIKSVELISEVLKDLSTQFKPNVDMIKKNIQTLIEKDYIETSSTDPNIFHYMA